jgi:hypothetical protein
MDILEYIAFIEKLAKKKANIEEDDGEAISHSQEGRNSHNWNEEER